MPLDEDTGRLLEDLRRAGIKPTHQLSPEEARANLKRRRAMDTTAPIPMVSVDESSVPTASGAVRVRIYRPSKGGELPILLYMHGGGWVTGDLDTQDFHCRTFAQGASCLVVSIDYSLAPETRFPTAAEECYAVLRWAAENATALGGDSSRIAIAGPSAGGNLAAAVALMARDRGGPPLVFQMLIYPVLDFSYETPSYRENARGFLLEKEDMQWYWAQYLASPDDGSHPYASPGRSPDLRGLPPAYIATAEFDPLRDEGEAYAERLLAAGVPVSLRRHAGLIHGFFGMTSAVPAARAAVDQAVEALERGLASP